jgi:KaiC/GvpD/RAD55 family RecA-like ATPase
MEISMRNTNRNFDNETAEIFREVFNPPSRHHQALEGFKKGVLTRFKKGLGYDENLETSYKFAIDPSRFNLKYDYSKIKFIFDGIWEGYLRENTNGIFQKTGNKLDFFTAKDLIGTEPPDREWVFKRLLPKKIVAALIAAGGTGKSFMAIHMAVASASGGMFLDEFISEKPIKVVYISGEDDQNELHRRLRSAVKSFSNSYKDLVKQNLSFIDFSSSFELFTNKLSYGETNITETPAKLIKLIQDKLGNEVGLIIIDPVSRFRGGEENSAPDTTRFVQTIQLLSEQLNSTVLLVHHVNKNARANGTGQNNARGSSALVDGVRLVMELNALSDKEMKDQFNITPGTKELLSLSVVKSNYSKKIMPITVEKTDDGSFAPFKQERGDYRKIEVLKKIHEKPSTKTEFRDKFGGVKKYFALSEKALVSLLDEMEEAGLIKIPLRGNMEITELGLASLSSSGQ